MSRSRLLRIALVGAAALVAVTTDVSAWIGRVREGAAVRQADATPASRVAFVAGAVSDAIAPGSDAFLGVREQALHDSDPSPDAASTDAPSADATAPEASPAESTPVIVSIGRETWVLAEPKWESRKLGYLRAGAVVRREATSSSRRDCRGGWFRVEPEGYVCAGARATLDPEHPVARLSARRPDLSALPYLYALTRYPTPPVYAKLPSPEEQLAIEGDVSGQLASIRKLARSPDFVAPPPADPMPAEVASGEALPAIDGSLRRRDQIALGTAKKHSGWAFLATFEQEGRRFGLTTDLALVPLDRTRIVRPSTFHGVELSDERGLPLAFVRARSARRLVFDGSGPPTKAGPLRWRSAVALTGREQRSRDGLILEASDGSWLRADQATLVDRFGELPAFARAGTKWIDISILRQTLVAYEGTRPVYATLVSTGKDGVADHRDSHATVQGTFLIHTKHVSVTMDSDDEKDEFDLRDVPYVQYFKEGYALHAAYWHDDFGNPRSHGCVNLSPRDAAWLFAWTTPEVPENWHAAMAIKGGTIVHIHP